MESGQTGVTLYMEASCAERSRCFSPGWPAPSDSEAASCEPVMRATHATHGRETQADARPTLNPEAKRPSRACPSPPLLGVHRPGRGACHHLGELGQRSSWLLEHGELTRFRTGGP